MGINAGNIASYAPPQEDDLARRVKDLERQFREFACARTGQAMQIGAGGILINNGGGLTISGTGAFSTNGAISTTGSISATTTVSAGTTVTAGTNVVAGGNISTSSGTVSGATVSSSGGMTATGNMSANGSGIFAAGVNSVGVYNNLLTVGYRVQYVDSVGDMGYVPSSRRFKQDITPAPDVTAAVMAMQIVNFRYNQAVAQLGDAAAIEWGVIAEDMDALGLKWAVDYDAEGKPFGVKYDRIVLAVIPMIQDHERRLATAGF